MGLYSNKTNTMSKRIITQLLMFLATVSFICSCSANRFEGKKLYILNANLDQAFIVEYLLDFTSSDKVKLSKSVYCNSMECLVDSGGTKGAVIKNYVVKNGVLTIDGLDSYPISFDSDSSAHTSDGATVYFSSINDVPKEEKQRRLEELFQGNNGLAKIFLNMLSKPAPQPLIEKKGDKLVVNSSLSKNNDLFDPPTGRSTNQNDPVSSNPSAENKSKGNGFFFVGTKAFCNPNLEDDCYKLTIKKDGRVLISNLVDYDGPVIKGKVFGSKIVDDKGSDLHFRYEPYHLYVKKEGEWIDYEEIKETQIGGEVAEPSSDNNPKAVMPKHGN